MSLNSICLVLGGARRGEFETLSEMGVKLGLILDSNSPGGTPVDHQFALIEKFDFQQAAADLLALIDKISENWHVEAVLNTREAYVSHHSAATRHLGLPSISESALRCVTNKTAMHNAFVEHIGKHSTALFSRAKSIEELPEIVAEIGFPLILKPTNLAASLFVQKCDTFDDLLTGFSSMQDSLRAHYKNWASLSVLRPRYR
ncbi:hypothetical protein [Chromobacterium vaccinii]|uniref:hypothetical protein n=1 Tax=Chromobacterium vaccinii TaxID=1108595 RepID=UPI000E13BD06|nr:hypothetical protein [Chromobacterium vaccinii]SUX55805.1 Alanine-anticapsin ligase BacD [Chromobacterium vaccinii]